MSSFEGTVEQKAEEEEVFDGPVPSLATKKPVIFPKPGFSWAAAARNGTTDADRAKAEKLIADKNSEMDRGEAPEPSEEDAQNFEKLIKILSASTPEEAVEAGKVEIEGPEEGAEGKGEGGGAAEDAPCKDV